MPHNNQQSSKKLQKLVDNQGSTTLATLEATMEVADKLSEVAELLANMPKTLSMEGVERVEIKGDKGDKGDSPTEDELLSLINPLIPEPIKGDKGESGIDGKDSTVPGPKGDTGPAGLDGYTPVKNVDYFDGKDGSPDTPEQIRDKLETLTEDERLDISAIKGVDFATRLDLTNAINNIKIPRNGGGSGGVEVFTAAGKVGSGSALKFTGSGVSNVTNDGHTTTIDLSGGGGGTPGGSDTQLQYNNAGAFGGISGATTNGTTVTYTTGNLVAHDVKASQSAGMDILSNNGTVTALFGAGGGANSTFYGGSKFDYATASTVPYFDASKNLISSAVTPTELGYLSGVTSAIQTQLNAKQATLVSGTNIKTINGATLLGSGDIVIDATVTLADLSSNSTTTPTSLYTMTSTIPVEFRSSDSNTILYIDETNERIGIGTASPGAKLSVQAASSGIGAIFQLSATTPSDLIQFQNSGGTVMGYISSTGNQLKLGSNFGNGNIKIGGGTAVTSEYGLQIDNIHNTSSALYGITGEVANSGTGTIIGMSFGPNSSHTSGTRSMSIAVEAVGRQTGVGGTLTNAYGVKINAYTNSGTITNQYGLHIADINTGTTNYAIYSVGGQSYFGGNIGLGVTSPSYKLDVLGDMRLGTTTASGTIYSRNATGGSSNPAIIFDTPGDYWANQQAVYDFRENGTSLISIDGLGNMRATTGNFQASSVSPETGNSTYIGNGMRRYNTTVGMTLAWGESISSTSEPGIDMFPIGGTMITNGILLRLSKDSSFSDVALQIMGDGKTGIGTTAPDRLLHEEVSDSGTNTVVYGQRHSHITSGTAAAGFGIGEEYELENASGTNRVAGTQEFYWSDATNATEDTTWTLNLMRAGTLTTQVTVESNGTLTAGQIIAGSGSPYKWAGTSARIYSPADGVIRFSNQADTPDFNRLQFGGTTSSFPSLKRSTTGFALRLADDSASTWQLASKLVEANTAGSGSPNIITESESGTVYTNEGAAALNYHTLPTAVAGLTFTFYVDDADGIRIIANTGDIIQINGVASASAGYAECTAIGGSLTLVAINATDWIATSVIGTWTLV